MKHFILTLFVFVIKIEPVNALVCSQIFSTTRSNYNDYIKSFANGSLKAPVVGFLNNRRYKKYLNRLDIDSLSRQKSPDRVIYEAYRELTKLSSYQTGAFSTALTEWVQREVFKKNVLNYLNQYPSPINSRYQRTIDKVRVFFRNPVISFVIDWTKLPIWLDKPINENLLRRIETDGMKPHLNELEFLYQSNGQFLRTQYHIFARTYRIVALTGSVVLIAYVLSQLPEKKNDALKEALTNQLDQIEMGLEALEAELDAALSTQ